MRKWQPWLCLGSLVLLAACSSTTAAPISSPSSAAQGWITYNEPAWGYSISMPADWHLVTAGELNPAQFKTFSFQNVTDASTLAGLDPDGMAFKIAVSNLNSGCPGPQPPVGWSESTVPAVAIMIDGYSAVVSGVQAQDKSVWITQAEAAKGKYCYSFAGLTLNHDAQVRWAPQFQQMVTTFRFGTPIAPPF